jgi:hypothetical protein
MKICPVGVELIQAEEQIDGHTTGMTKLIVAFRNISNAPKNVTLYEV